MGVILLVVLAKADSFSVNVKDKDGIDFRLEKSFQKSAMTFISLNV